MAKNYAFWKILRQETVILKLLARKIFSATFQSFKRVFLDSKPSQKAKTTWNVAAVSEQGTSHKKQNIPCQDAQDCQILSNGVILIAVADGAGSANRSGDGAQCAVKEMIELLKTALVKELPQDEAGWEALLTQAFDQTRQVIDRRATVENISLEAFATTLTCAIASAEWLAVGQMGDGVVVARTEDNELFAATRPQFGEYTNETFFLTMTDVLPQIKVQRQSIQALAVMTDGLIYLAMNMANNDPHRPFFEPLLDFVAQIEDQKEAEAQLSAFLASERVCLCTDDDKTLVLAVRLPTSDTETSSTWEAPLITSQEAAP